MNELVERLRKDNSPVIFRCGDLENLDIDKRIMNILLSEALKKGWIDKIYDDIYVLGKEFRKSYISEYVLAQMFEPQSYVSTNYVLYESNWIVDGITVVTCVTNNEKKIIDTEKYGSFYYEKIDYQNSAGIYWNENESGKYRKASPLRALCDLIYLRDDNLYENIEYLTEYLRIPYSLLKNEVKKEEIDELSQGIKKKNISIFLDSLKKELF